VPSLDEGLDVYTYYRRQMAAGPRSPSSGALSISHDHKS
jgi:hypothetical protein